MPSRQFTPNVATFILIFAGLSGCRSASAPPQGSEANISQMMLGRWYREDLALDREIQNKHQAIEFADDGSCTLHRIWNIVLSERTACSMARNAARPVADRWQDSQAHVARDGELTSQNSGRRNPLGYGGGIEAPRVSLRQLRRLLSHDSRAQGKDQQA